MKMPKEYKALRVETEYWSEVLLKAKEGGLTNKDLAEKAFVSQSTISNIIAGRQAKVRPEIAEKLRLTFEVVPRVKKLHEENAREKAQQMARLAMEQKKRMVEFEAKKGFITKFKMLLGFK
jgi:transcriptional regulator with XRE-family HTH domain